MTPGEFDRLKEGERIRNKCSGDAYIIVSKHYDRDAEMHTFTVIRAIEATNPPEWEKP